MTAALDPLQAALPAVATGVSADGIRFFIVPRAELPAVARQLRDELGFIRFIDLTAVDAPDEDERFELNYLLYSMEAHRWVRIKAYTNDAAPSITSIFPAADFFEREVYDLFGVIFDGHPKLTRIMMPDDWVGYPLRKEYPMGGEPVDFTVTREIYGTGDRKG